MLYLVFFSFNLFKLGKVYIITSIYPYSKIDQNIFTSKLKDKYKFASKQN